METVNLKHLGREPFSTSHGNQRIEFAPGETKKVQAHLAELLLAEVHIDRKYKRGGGIESEETTPLFEITEITVVAAPVKNKKGDQQ